MASVPTLAPHDAKGARVRLPSQWSWGSEGAAEQATHTGAHPGDPTPPYPVMVEAGWLGFELLPMPPLSLLPPAWGDLYEGPCGRGLRTYLNHQHMEGGSSLGTFPDTQCNLGGPRLLGWGRPRVLSGRKPQRFPAHGDSGLARSSQGTCSCIWVQRAGQVCSQGPVRSGVCSGSGHQQLRIGPQPRPLTPHGPSTPCAIFPTPGPK